METVDKELAARVWQRVHGQAEQTAQPDTKGLLALIAQEWTAAETYLLLARKFQGKPSAALRRLAQQEQSHAACLKGIYTLMTGEHPAVRTAPPESAPVETVLRRCYGGQMRRLAAYEARSSDPEYGRVFDGLAQQERHNCHALLEILGSIQRTQPPRR